MNAAMKPASESLPARQRVQESFPTRRQVKERFTSLEAWKLPKQKSALAPDHVWTNVDMDPIALKNQTWSLWTYMAYWATDTINLGTWETASSIIDSGLTWRDAIPIMVVGTSCVAVPMVLNGAIGAKLHVPFSVAIRSSFGYYFAYFCIVSRAILAMFWLGIQSWNGAECVTVMIAAIWPSYLRMGNHIAASQNPATTMTMLSYFIFWIVQLPLLLIPPTKLRWLFIVKLFGAPVAALAMMGWTVHKAGGGGAIFQLPGTVHGSTRAWLWLSCMSSVTGSWATLACNIPDFSRYSRNPRGQFIQLPFLPMIFTLCGVIGIITTSATKIVYGEFLWNPLDILINWIESGSHGGRAAAFFCGLAWYVAQVGTNITANSISAANDLTVLFPKYVNIRRGCLIAAVIAGWVMVPWKILGSASTFLNFMGGYALFLAPIAGILASDFWLVKNQHIDVPALYDPAGRYSYTWGINWRAAVAFLIAVIPCIPGLAQSIESTTSNPISIGAGLKNLYTFDWLYGFVVSIFMYTTLSKIFPASESLIEHTVYGHDEGYLDGEEQSSVKYDRKDSGNADDVEIGLQGNIFAPPHDEEKKTGGL